MNRHDIYRNRWYRLFIRSLERVAGSHVFRHLDYLDKTQRISREELRALQWEKLRRLLIHAYRFVPYYKKLMDGEGIGPEDLRSIEDFKKFPILTKDKIRGNLEELKATGSARPMRVVQAQTGGTTGEPLKFLRDTECISFTRAALLRSYIWTGYRIGESMLFLTGGSLLGAPQTLKQRASFSAMNFHFLPGFRIRRETLSLYVNFIVRKKIKYLRGYSTVIHQLASLCESEGVDDIFLEAAYPTAEMLTRAQRDTIERVFHCRVYDHYGCAEINSLANECPEARSFHIIEEHVVMEEENLETSGEHALLVTDLDNYAQPFIRYANSDRGKLSTELCSCGRNLAVLEEFLGRSSDAVYLSSGDTYPGVFFHHLFGHFAGVDQFQVVQDEPGELQIVIIRNARFKDEDEGKIKGLVQEHLDIVPAIEYCSEIPRSSSGKITSVICRVKKGA